MKLAEKLEWQQSSASSVQTQVHRDTSTGARKVNTADFVKHSLLYVPLSYNLVYMNLQLIIDNLLTF